MKGGRWNRFMGDVPRGAVVGESEAARCSSRRFLQLEADTRWSNADRPKTRCPCRRVRAAQLLAEQAVGELERSESGYAFETGEKDIRVNAVIRRFESRWSPMTGGMTKHAGAARAAGQRGATNGTDAKRDQFGKVGNPGSGNGYMAPLSGCYR